MTPKKNTSSLDFFTLDDFDVTDRTVIVRIDINSPVDPITGKLLGDRRLRRHAETIRRLRKAKVVILAHQSRPGKADFTTLYEHAKRLGTILGQPVIHIDDLVGSTASKAIQEMNPGDIIMLENTRLYSEEIALSGSTLQKQASTHIVRNIAPLADIFINDAFAAAHRSQPSLTGFFNEMPMVAGKVMEKELVTLEKIMGGDHHPSMAIFGGIKVDDSINVARHMLEKDAIDIILTTGVVGNTFIHAKGTSLGKVNEEFCFNEMPGYPKLLEDAKDLLSKYGDKIRVPVDVAVSKENKRVQFKVEELPVDYPLFDIGMETIMSFRKEIENAEIIVVNGPAGLFEIEEFSIGTHEIFKAVADSNAFSVMGGGETTAICDRLGLSDKIDHLSTGGGALISYLAGRKMPVIDGLKASKVEFSKSTETRERALQIDA